MKKTSMALLALLSLAAVEAEAATFTYAPLAGSYEKGSALRNVDAVPEAWVVRSSNFDGAIRYLVAYLNTRGAKVIQDEVGAIVVTGGVAGTDGKPPKNTFFISSDDDFYKFQNLLKKYPDSTYSLALEMKENKAHK